MVHCVVQFFFYSRQLQKNRKLAQNRSQCRGEVTPHSVIVVTSVQSTDIEIRDYVGAEPAKVVLASATNFISMKS